MFWSYEINTDDLSGSFVTLLEKDLNTKGTWKEDFLYYCTQFNITPCPLISSGNITGDNFDKEFCKISNGIIDLCSWRAMLLACCSIGSKVIEISVHFSKLTSQHFIDLSKALERSGTIQIVKLQYLQCEIVEDNIQQYCDAFKLLLSDSTNLKYLSLKGSLLGDDFIKSIIPSLTTNFRLQSINLSENLLSDSTIIGLFSAIKLNSNIKYFSFANNQINGICLNDGITPLLLGSLESKPEDETLIKTNLKLITDKNKQLKDVNKKRKKSGYPELSDIEVPSECITKKDGKSIILNNSFKSIDFSYNSIDSLQVSSFFDKIKTSSTDIAISTSKLDIIIKGLILSDSLSNEIKSFENPLYQFTL